MALVTEKELQTEIVNFARSLIKDPDASYTTTSQSFSGNGALLTFTLTKFASCINSVTVGTAKKWGLDYTYNFTTKVLTFVTAPAAGTNNVVVSHDYEGTGTTLASINGSWCNWAYPSLGRMPEDYPLMGMEWLSNTRGAIGLGYDGVQGERVMRIWVYSDSIDESRLKLREAANDFMTKTDWYIGGAMIGSRVVPIVGPVEPALDARRKGRYFGGFVDILFPMIYESSS